MGTWLLKLWCFLTRQRAVVMQDHDLELKYCPARMTPFGLVADRYWPLKVRSVFLNEDGTTTGCNYVRRWKPL